ncbi:hypothetical protein AVEN_209803-1 [Araneus ventricosus]|uniref:Uncharacterized protein n=1 Tax=Araneus ventricosus TaxID=182803 RepID=A0A4Y2Q0G4_ARAVE|nr:hypothetical protein AVEN_209803-1 [Araneus ventricosus]
MHQKGRAQNRMLWPRAYKCINLDLHRITRHGPSHPIFSDSENTLTTAVPVENLARLFTMPPSAASSFLTTSGVQQINP